MGGEAPAPHVADEPEAWEALDEPLDEPARASSRGPTSERVRSGSKPELEVHARSDDGHDFHVDLRKVSPLTRHVIRQLEKRGSVQLSEIPLADLPIISQWFRKEIAVVQTPYGKLRIILGERNRIISLSILPGERFLVHTHPMAVSRKDHFSLDLRKAGDDIEAAVDWNGNITFYNGNGIKNPVRNDGVVESGFFVRVAFLDENGNVKAVARTRAVRSKSSADIEVMP